MLLTLKKTGLAFAVAMAAAAPAHAVDMFRLKDNGVRAAFVGDYQCSAWKTGDRASPDNARKVNWVLGFLYGRASQRGRLIPGANDTDRIWTMVDTHCAVPDHGNHSMATTGYYIERELQAKKR